MSHPKHTQEEENLGSPGYLASAFASVSHILTSAFNLAKEKELSSPTLYTEKAIVPRSKFVVNGALANDQNQPEQLNGIAMNGVSLLGVSNEVSPSPITLSGSKLVVIGPLANVDNQPEQLNALNRVHLDVAKRMTDILNDRKPYHEFYYADFVSVLTSEPFGGVRNMFRCANNIMRYACDIYLDLWYNQSRVDEINFVACESGAYLAVKLIQFIDLYGDSFVNSMDNFNIVWSKFLSGQRIDLPTQPGSKMSKICRTVILVDPSLPAPRRLAKWLDYRSVMYDQLKLVAPKGDSGERLCLVLHTGLVTATHYGVEIEGAESFGDDGVIALVERFKNFINT